MKIALATLLVLVGIRAALPWIAERAIERVLSVALSARVELDDVDLRLHDGEIVFEHVVLRAADTDAELLRARRIVLDIELAPLLSGVFSAERLTIDGPRLVFAFDSTGRFNWAGVGARARAEPQSEEPPAPAFDVRIVRVDIGNGTVSLADESDDGLPDVNLSAAAFTLEGIEVGRSQAGAPLRWALAGADASDWQLGIAPARGEAFDFAVHASAGPIAQAGSIPLELRVSREGGGQLEVKGEMRLTPLEAAVRISWNGLRSRAVLPLLAIEGAVVERGVSSGTLDLAFTLAEVPERGLRVSGQATHENLALEIEGDEPMRIEVARVTADLTELHVPIPATSRERVGPVRVHLARIEVDEPVLSATLTEGPAKPEPEAVGEADETDAPRAPIVVRLDTFTLRSGSVSWRDPTIGANHQQSLSSISVEAKALRWPPAAFDAATIVVGSLGAEPLRIEGSWVPGEASVDVDGSRIALAPWNPTISHYSDYSISRGELSLQSRFRLRGDDYEAPTRIVLHRLKATSEGQGFQQTFGIPLAEAIPLLSDPAGNIRLKAPIHGRPSEGGSVDLVPAITDAVREAIMNALASVAARPVDTAGGALRRLGEAAFLGIGEAAFLPGQAEFDFDAKLVLASAAELVRNTPGDRLQLVTQIVSDDLQALNLAPQEGGVLDTIVAAGKSLLGGGPGRKLDADTRKRVEALAIGRFEVIERYIREKTKLDPRRVVRTPWDAKVREGTPRVMLRLLRQKK